MANSSATGGALLPSGSPAPLEGDALDDFLQAWLVSLTGIAPTLVRPRWQPTPANIPAFGTDWVAFGVSNFDRETFAAEQHIGTGQGYNEVRAHEELTCLASFYGPNSANYAAMFRDNMQVAQNREVLTLNGMGLVSSGNIIPMPEVVKERWLKRFDLNVVIRRIVVRDYPVLNILTAQLSLNNELYTEVINVP